MSKVILNPNLDINFSLLKNNFYFDEIEKIIQSGEEWSISPGSLISLKIHPHELYKIILIGDVVKSLEFPNNTPISFSPGPDLAQELNNHFKKWSATAYKIKEEKNKPFYSYVFYTQQKTLLKIENIFPSRQKINPAPKYNIPNHTIFFKYEAPTRQVVMELSIL